MNLRNLLSALAFTVTLAACGGGDTIEVPVVDDTIVPASATASAASYNAFVAQVALDDTREPLTLGAGLAPTSEEDEPVSVVR